MEFSEFAAMMAVLLPWVLFGTFCLLGSDKDRPAR